MRRLKDRGLNPFDGSRRRLDSEEHVHKKKYKRKRQHEIKKEFLEEWSLEHFIDEEE